MVIKILLCIFLSTNVMNLYSQSFVLRVGGGFTFFNTKIDKSIPSSLDNTFKGKSSSTRLSGVLALELLYPRFSFELAFASQQYSYYMFTDYTVIGLKQEHKGNGGISQFQLLFNKFINNKILEEKNFVPLVSVGLGLGINRPKSFYDSSSYSSIFYSSVLPNEYIKYDQKTKFLNTFSYSLLFKVGGALKIRDIERLRIYGIYNLGLNKFNQTDIEYYHTSKKYYGSNTSKGSQFTIRLSMPIYLKRFDKK